MRKRVLREAESLLRSGWFGVCLVWTPETRLLDLEVIRRIRSCAPGCAVVLLAPPADLDERWAGPYCRRSDLEDPWGRQFIYVANGVFNPGGFDLISFGADGGEGGDGENADIYND